MSDRTRLACKDAAISTAPALPLVALAACSEPVETLEPWPFTVEQVSLSCEWHEVPEGRRPRRVFVTTPDGRRYGANGSAMAVAPRTDPIQSHYDARAVIERGLRLCDRFEGPITIRRPAVGPPRIPPPPSVQVDESEPFLGTQFTIGGEPANGARRPELTFSCGGEVRNNIMFDFGAEPRVPPPLRGAFGTLSIGTERPTRVEFAWGGGRYWSPRNTHLDRALVRRFLDAGKLSATPPEGSLPATRVTWTTDALGRHLAAARRLCR